jgi:hypothetical protein
MSYSQVLRVTPQAHAIAYTESNLYKSTSAALLYSEPDFGEGADNPGSSRSSLASKLPKSVASKRYVLVSADI